MTPALTVEAVTLPAGCGFGGLMDTARATRLA